MELIVRDRTGKVLARAEHPTEALLSLVHAWAEGDCVEIFTPKGAHLWLRMDAAVPEGEASAPVVTCSGMFHGVSVG